MESAVLKKLMTKAGRLLARRAYGRAELGQKLAPLADASDIEQVLDHLTDLRLLNDANYAYNFSFHRLTELGWGPARVRRELTQRRVEGTIVEAAIARVLDDSGEEAILDRYLARYTGRRGWPADRKGIGRLVTHLRRRGFSPERVYRALREQIGAEAWDRFDTGE
jgi:regulatory protein